MPVKIHIKVKKQNDGSFSYKYEDDNGQDAKSAKVDKRDMVGWKLHTEGFTPNPKGFCVTFVDLNYGNKQNTPFWPDEKLCPDTDDIPNRNFSYPPGGGPSSLPYGYTVSLKDTANHVPPNDPDIIIIDSILIDSKHFNRTLLLVLAGVGIGLTAWSLRKLFADEE
jgi:hypothetical protein